MSYQRHVICGNCSHGHGLHANVEIPTGILADDFELPKCPVCGNNTLRFT